MYSLVSEFALLKFTYRNYYFRLSANSGSFLYINKIHILKVFSEMITAKDLLINKIRNETQENSFDVCLYPQLVFTTCPLPKKLCPTL